MKKVLNCSGIIYHCIPDCLVVKSFLCFSAKEERTVSALKILEKDYLSVKGALAVQTAAESRWKCERAALLTQISNMNKQLVHLQNQIEAAGKELSKSRQVVILYY